MKRCTRCKKEKEEGQFPKNKRYISGINARCKSCMNDINRVYRTQNSQSFSDSRKRHYQRNISVMRKQKMDYVAKHKPAKVAYDVIYRAENADRIRAYKKEWELQRRNNPEFKIKRNLRRRIHHVLKGHTRSASTFDLIGCSLPNFINHIESQFQEGMNWENYSTTGWHIDHIVPCCQFDLTSEDQQKQCFHYTNQRPLWAKDNLRKGKRLDTALESSV